MNNIVRQPQVAAFQKPQLAAARPLQVGNLSNLLVNNTEFTTLTYLFSLPCGVRTKS